MPAAQESARLWIKALVNAVTHFEDRSRCLRRSHGEFRSGAPWRGMQKHREQR